MILRWLSIGKASCIDHHDDEAERFSSGYGTTKSLIMQTNNMTYLYLTDPIAGDGMCIMSSMRHSAGKYLSSLGWKFGLKLFLRSELCQWWCSSTYLRYLESPGWSLNFTANFVWACMSFSICHGHGCQWAWGDLKEAGPSSPAEGWANLTTRVFYSKLLYTVASIDTRCIDSNIREWEIHI